MKKKILIVISIIVVLGLGYFIYGRMTGNSGGSSDYIKGLYPASVIDTFYTSYIKIPETMEKRSFYRSSKYLTDDYKKALNEKYSNGNVGEYDHLLCAVGNPLGINIKDPMYSGDESASVVVEANYAGLYSSMLLEMKKDKGEWRISNVECPSDPPAPLTEGSVQLYYMKRSAESETEDCTQGDFVRRPLDLSAGAGSIRDELGYQTLRELFSGPTDEDMSSGFESVFSSNTSGILNTVQINADVAFVDLTDIRGTLSEASEGCGRDQFFSQVIESLGKNLDVTEVIFSINGNSDIFYNWTGTVCRSEACTTSQPNSAPVLSN